MNKLNRERDEAAANHQNLTAQTPDSLKIRQDETAEAWLARVQEAFGVKP